MVERSTPEEIVVAHLLRGATDALDDPAGFLHNHPDRADELKALLADDARMARLREQVRARRRVSTPADSRTPSAAEPDEPDSSDALETLDGGTIDERLRARYGSAVGERIELVDEDRTLSDEGALSTRPPPRPAAEERGSSSRLKTAAQRAKELGDELSAEAENPGHHIDLPDIDSELMRQVAARGPLGRRYRMRGVIGRGGMGAVLKVFDKELRRHLAMKILLGRNELKHLAKRPDIDPKSLSRFLEEAQITSQLDHPGIVPVHEVGLDPAGRVFFTMKLVKGCTFADVIDRTRKGVGGWNLTRALGVVLKVCEAMVHAHKRGVIHRDLKPHNVMVGDLGEVFVMDWGLARVLGRPETRTRPRADSPEGGSPMPIQTERRGAPKDPALSPLVTIDGEQLGTPSYMSPEQAAGTHERVSVRSDVYAVGAVLYHLVCGTMPYVDPGVRTSGYDVLGRVLKGPPKPIATFAPDLPSELQAICEKAMARDPAQRYASMLALAEDLRAYLEDRVVRAYPVGALAEARKWVRRNRPQAIAAAAVLLVLVAGFAIVALRQRYEMSLAGLRDDIGARESELAKKSGDLTALNATLEGSRSALAEAQQSLAEVKGRNEYELSQELRRLREQVAAAENKTQHELGRSDQERAELQQLRQAVADAEAREKAADARYGEMRDRFAAMQSAVEAAGKRAPTAGAASPEQAALIELLQLDALFASADALWPTSAAAMKRIDEWLERAAAVSAARDPAGAVIAAIDADRDAAQAAGDAARVALLEQQRAQLDAALGRVGELERIAAEMRERQARGRDVEKQSLVDAAAKWESAGRAVKSDHGLQLAPQFGLVPLGRDPSSKLQEFWLIASGDEPQRDRSAKLQMTEASGLVLVLLPGGKDRVGAQKKDKSKPNYFAQAEDAECGADGLAVAVELEPYFIAKYEMTQAQWERLTGFNPSAYRPGAEGESFVATQPVESISWDDCMRWLPHLGLALPTEAQWESACRAGSGSPWFTGTESKELADCANVCDLAYARRFPAVTEDGVEQFDDGFVFPGPVGAMGKDRRWKPNKFGLFDALGNVQEWCLDVSDGLRYGEPRKGTGLFESENGGVRVSRGGSFFNFAGYARSASRAFRPPGYVGGEVGVRPARALD